MMKYILTERQYRLISEQSQPVKIELPKDKHVVSKFCKPIPIPRKNLETISPEELEESTNLILGPLRRRFKSDFKSVTDKNESTKLSKIIPKLEVSLKSIIESSLRNDNLSRSGYAQYDITNDAKKLAETFYNVFNSEYNTLVNRTVLRALITPKNKNELIKEVEDYFNSIETAVARLDMAGRLLWKHKNYDFLQSMPDKGLCKKVLVVKEDGYKTTPYHPQIGYFESPNYSPKEVDTEAIVKPYFDKIIQLINSLA